MTANLLPRRAEELTPAWLLPATAAWLTIAVAVAVLASAIALPAAMIPFGYAVLALAHGLLRRRWALAGPITVLTAAAGIVLLTVPTSLHLTLRRAGQGGDSNGATVAWAIVLGVVAIGLVALTARHVSCRSQG